MELFWPGWPSKWLNLIASIEILWMKEHEKFGDSALYGELITLNLRVVWFNDVLLQNAKAYTFKTCGTSTGKPYKMLTKAQLFKTNDVVS